MQPGDDEILARALHEQLKPVRGPAPQLGHVRAALLMARHDMLSSREACRRADVSENARQNSVQPKVTIPAVVSTLHTSINASFPFLR